MSNLNNRAVLHKDWTTFALRTLAGFHACEIAIFDPSNADQPITIDPFSKTVSGNRTAKPRRIWQGQAQLQVYRQALTMDDVAGSVSMVRSVRIELPLNATTERIIEGYVVRVINDPRSAVAETYEYTVTSALVSPLAFKLTIEAEADQRVIAPPITDYS